MPEFSRRLLFLFSIFVCACSCGRDRGQEVRSQASGIVQDGCRRVYAPHDFQGAMTVSGEKQVAVWHVTYQLHITSRMTYEIRPNEALMDVESQLASATVKPQAAAGAVQKQAEAAIQEENGARVMALATPEALETLAGGNAEYAALGCAVIPTVRQIFPHKGQRTIVDYDPPLPVGINPTAPAEDLEAEIGSGRSWHHIKATVVQSTSSSTPAGSVFHGDVTLTPSVSKDGLVEYRFKFAFDVPQPADSLAIGLAPHTAYAVDRARKTYARAAFATFQEDQPGDDMIYRP